MSLNKIFKKIQWEGEKLIIKKKDKGKKKNKIRVENREKKGWKLVKNIKA